MSPEHTPALIRQSGTQCCWCSDQAGSARECVRVCVGGDQTAPSSMGGHSTAMTHTHDTPSSSSDMQLQSATLTHLFVTDHHSPALPPRPGCVAPGLVTPLITVQYHIHRGSAAHTHTRREPAAKCCCWPAPAPAVAHRNAPTRPAAGAPCSKRLVCPDCLSTKPSTLSQPDVNSSRHGLCSAVLGQTRPN